MQLFSNGAFFFLSFSPSGKKFFFNSLPKSAEHVRNLHEEPGPMLMFEHMCCWTPPPPHPARTVCLNLTPQLFLFFFCSNSREVKLVRELRALKL